MTKRSLVKGAAVLAIAGIFVKILGAFFRVPLGNIIGEEGMANYAPAYALYATLLVISTSGIPIAISKMVSERCAIGQFREAERVFKLSRILMITIGVFSFVLLFFFDEIIADLVRIPGAALSMKATAPALILVPIMSAYRGYFQVMQEMVPTAVSQVIEQMFRVVLGLSAAILLMRSSWLTDFTVNERGAAGGCFGASAGAIGGLITMVVIYLICRKKLKRRIHADNGKAHESSSQIIKRIAIIAIPITIGAMIMPLVNLVDSAIVNVRLLDSGWEPAVAKGMYGQLTGYAEPIVEFPQVLMTSIVVSLVPMVSAANRLGNTKELHGHITLGVRMSLILAFPCAIGLFVLAEPSLLLLYPAQRAGAIGAAPCLQVLALAFVLLSLITNMTGVLQGIGKQILPVRNLFIGIVVKIAVTWILTAIPQINIVGATLGTTAAYMVAAFLDVMAVRKYTKVKIKMGMVVTKPLISSLVMGAIVFFSYKGIFALLGSNAVATLVAILIGIIVYGLMILKTKAITRAELLDISMGQKIVKVCDKLRLW
ncbi:MAG: polysaccharide biosynthesis protein [Clostridiales bacterium]|nr:polysaccharide biosynthesis protein [Clostridiales bacterium]